MKNKKRDFILKSALLSVIGQSFYWVQAFKFESVVFVFGSRGRSPSTVYISSEFFLEGEAPTSRLWRILIDV